MAIRVTAYSYVNVEDPEDGSGEYIFAGWYTDDSLYTEYAFLIDSMPVTDNLVLYAKWRKKL